MMSKEIMLLFYRNGLNLMLSLIFISSLIHIYKSKNIKNYIFTSFIYFLVIMTREDFIWLLPSLVITLIITNDLWYKKILIPFIIY